jgi:TolB-like protein/tetratricopeptide (TPR) repeat protein
VVDGVNRRFYEFGHFRLDGTGRVLFQGEEAVPLSPKAADVLLLLLQNAGNVVEKKELLSRVWQDAIVEEGSLTRTISILRKVLEAGDEGQECIATVSKRGYRFMVPVKEITGERSVGDKTLLAVLPFENLSGDPNQEYFSDGLTEEMITQLSQLNPEKLGVIARTSAMRYKNTRKSVRRIGQELGVAYLLEGSVLRVGRRVRITAQLIQVSDQTHLWARKYERGVGDILAIQSDVATAIASEIEIKLAPQAEARLGRTAMVEPRAYEAYLRGRFLWNQRTGKALHESLPQFEKSIQYAPRYAPAYAGMADSYLSLLDDAYLPPRAAMAQARQWAEQAIAIDEAFAEPHSSLGHAHYHEFEWMQAEQEFRRSLTLNPNYPSAHFYYAHYLVATARQEEAVGEAKKALALDPVSLAAQTNLAIIYYRAARYDEAVGEARRVLDIDANYAHAHYVLGRAYVQTGMYRKAILSSRKAVALEGSNVRYLASLAHIYGIAGKRSKASALLNKIKSTMVQRYVPAYMVAICYVGLGKRDEALAWLTRAYEERSAESPFVSVDPRLTALRAEARFRQMLRKLGLSQ